MASSLNIETDGITLSMSDPSDDPLIAISIFSVESSPPDEHGPIVRLVPQLHNRQTHKSLESLSHRLPSMPQLKSETDTLEPKQYGTDNAISYVITYEICSLLPPYASMLRQQLDIRIAVSGLFGHTHPGPA